MEFILLSIVLSVLLFNCQNKNSQLQTQTVSKKTLDTVYTIEENKNKAVDSLVTIKNETIYGLILTSNALQVINKNTGSTSEIPFGNPIEEMIATITTILQLKPTNIRINKECGAVPLKMVKWSNGLTLVFQQKDSVWMFAGWSAGIP